LLSLLLLGDASFGCCCRHGEVEIFFVMCALERPFDGVNASAWVIEKKMRGAHKRNTIGNDSSVDAAFLHR